MNVVEKLKILFKGNWTHVPLWMNQQPCVSQMHSRSPCSSSLLCATQLTQQSWSLRHFVLTLVFVVKGHSIYFVLIHVIKFNLLLTILYVYKFQLNSKYISFECVCLASVKYFTCSCLKFNELSISHSSLVIYLFILSVLELSLLLLFHLFVTYKMQTLRC